MGQELWLQEKQLSKLTSLGTQFVARSGMEERVESGIYRGRPYGGVSIAWNENLNHVVQPLSNYKHNRIVGVEVRTDIKNLLILCVYMPYHDTRSRDNREACIMETIDTLSMIENILDDFPNHHVIIGGDLNTELDGSSPFDPL
jgi:hypothetical protein